jgi:hypothetical protein
MPSMASPKLRHDPKSCDFTTTYPSAATFMIAPQPIPV